MVDLMLDDLSRPAGEGLQAGLEGFILVFDLDGTITLGLARARQGQTSLLCTVGSLRLYDLGVEHYHVCPLVIKGNDTLEDADHIGRHAHTARGISGERIQQVLGCFQILRRGGSRFLGQKQLVFHNRPNHRLTPSSFPIRLQQRLPESVPHRSLLQAA